jgi:site-specific DNA-methyltransferase (adenine-specific)
MEFMASVKDNAYDLAIVDIQYGIDQGGGKNHSRGKLVKSKNYKDFGDKETMPPEYHIELKRISKNQIIWGANHFIQNIPNANSSCWIVWDKDNGKTDFADSELALTSFDSAVRNFKYRWQGMLQQDMKNKENRIHPTQKPVALYKWLLQNYAKSGDKILDTHGGSGSICIACHDLGFDLDWMELDKDYYDSAVKRYNNHASQLQFELCTG